MPGPGLDILKQVLHDNVEEVARHLLPKGRRTGPQWRVGSLQGDEGTSLLVTLSGPRKGTWRDLSTGEGGDLLSLWCAVRGLFIKQAIAEIIDWLHLPRPEPPPQPTEKKPADLAYLLSTLRPIEGTVVETYLRHRGLDLPPQGHGLRFWPSRPPSHPWSAMVGLVTDFRDAGKVLSLHTTKLAHDGKGKAPIEAPRSFLAGHAIRHGVVRLCDDAEVALRLGLAEGIETALAVTTAFARAAEPRREPVWAALSASTMGNLPVLPGQESLVIYADRGPAGESAADRLAGRWADAGREAFVSIAPLDDWNSP